MKKHLACILAITIGAGGCASVTQGRKFDESRIPEISKGRTTKQAIISMLGDPQSKNIDTNGNERLTYFYSETKAKMDPRMFIPIVGLFFLRTKAEGQSRTLLVTLKNSVVSDYSYNEGGSVGESMLGPK